MKAVNYMSGSGTFTYIDPDNGEVWEKIEFDGFPYMVNKIDSTHFYMAPEKAVLNRGQGGRPATYHVAEWKHNPEFYEELVDWLKGREMIGGKSFMESNKNEKNIIEIKEEVKIGNAILERGDKIRVLESMQRDAFIFKAEDDLWYYFIAYKEYGEYPDGSFHGPFSNEERAEEHMSDNHSNPGGYHVDDSGTREAPKLRRR